MDHRPDLDRAAAQREFFASLPVAALGASVVLRDPSGRVVLVEPTYQHHWLLPGGTVEYGEQPHDAARRETREELDLTLPDRLPLVVVDWVGPDDDIGRPVFLHFVFDGGTLSPSMADRVRLPVDELSSWKLATPEDWRTLMRPRGARRLDAAVAVVRDGTGCCFCVAGTPVDETAPHPTGER